MNERLKKMNKQSFLLTVLMILLVNTIFIGCTTIKNLNDYDNQTYSHLDYSNEKVLGKVKVSTMNFMWTSFSPEDFKTERLVKKLEEKALSKYGKNIKLVDIEIGKINPAISIPMWTLGGGLAIGSLYIDQYDTGLTIFTTSLLTAMFKSFQATATVVVSDEPYIKGSYTLISEDNLEYKRDLNNIGINKKYLSNNSDYQLITTYDEFRDVTFIYNKFFNDSTNPIEIYLGKNSNSKWIRITFTYTGSDWIFFNTAYLINNTGDRLSWAFNTFEKSTEVLSGGNVFEHIDIELSDTSIEKLDTLLKNGVVKLRLTGEKNKDYTLDSNQVLALVTMLDAYNDL